MEIGQGPNWGCSAIIKKSWYINETRRVVAVQLEGMPFFLCLLHLFSMINLLQVVVYNLDSFISTTISVGFGLHTYIPCQSPFCLIVCLKY
jgi:hypothetical protein